MIRQEPLDCPNGNGLIQLRPSAGGFARVRAYPPADAGKHVVPTDQIQCLRISSDPRQGKIALDIDSQRTFLLTGGGLSFVDDRTAGQASSRFKVNGFPGGINRCRTRLDAVSTKGAPIRVDKNRPLLQTNPESLRRVLD